MTASRISGVRFRKFSIFVGVSSLPTGVLKVLATPLLREVLKEIGRLRQKT